VEHFGCRAARADGEAIGHQLRAAGLGERQPSAADVVVVNTCSVTAEADRAALAFIRRTHRLNAAARIVVTGCFAQRAPEELAGLEGVSAVVACWGVQRYSRTMAWYISKLQRTSSER
jgi:threonylcarbamoyladenosine tRNA methylthiotransferase MtaB